MKVIEQGGDNPLIDSYGRGNLMLYLCAHIKQVMMGCPLLF